ncbi:MAG: Gfo/Idh/MocA family oxidoreductase [Planctomycetes bacterium]|nr:Gfo/Idh/MocA family oxidoreductase [Planctomycetota bacterium]
MSEETLTLGIIGAGNIATRHLANLDFIGGNRVVGIADMNLDLAKEKANPVGATAYADWREMLDKEPLDGVLLCTPPVLRKAVFEAAVEKKVAVFCEKPPARNAEEAREITKVVEDSGMICSVGFNCRYAPSVDKCKALIGDKKINIVRAAVISPAALPGPGRLEDWFFLKEKGGGLFDVMIHTLDLTRYVAGEVATVHAFGTNVIIPKSETFTIEETMSINMLFDSGATASVVSTWACAQGTSDLTFFGEDFQISLRPIPPRLNGKIGAKGEKAESCDEDFPQGPAMGRSGQVHPNRKPEDPPDPPHHDEMKVFLEAIRTGSMGAIRSPFADAAGTMALVDAITRSIESGSVEQV